MIHRSQTLDISTRNNRIALARFPGKRIRPVRWKTASTTPAASLDLVAIAEIAICALPALTLVYLDHRTAAGAWLYLAVLLLLLYHLLEGRIACCGALVVGLTPVLMLLRGDFYYNMPIALLAGIVICWLITTRGDAAFLWTNVYLRLILLFTVGYWLVSFGLTGDYASNLRALELSLTVCAICLLAGSRRYLLTALAGIILSTLAICIAMMPVGERLGMASVGGVRLGNPISLGIPLTLAVTLAIADGGKWLALEGKTLQRVALGITSAGLLLLTTSRGSVAVILGILAVLLLVGRKQRRTIAVFLVLLVLSVPVLLSTSRGQYVDQWYGRTVSSERSMSQITSGRSDQWLLFPRLFRESPLWGFGPGLGRSEYAKYSVLNDRIVYRPGKEAEWHSLYLQLGVETGLIGLICLIGLLVRLLLIDVRYFRRTNEIVPLLGVVGFVVVALSVSGMDAISGVLLGLGFLPTSAGAGVRKAMIQIPAAQILPLTRRQARRNLRWLMEIDAQTIGEPWGPEQWLKDLDEKWELSRIILRGREPIGFIVASLKGQAIHIHRLAIKDLYRGQGHGAELLREVAGIGNERSLSTLTLKVSKENEQALGFYQRLGFLQSGGDGRNVELAIAVRALLERIEN